MTRVVDIDMKTTQKDTRLFKEIFFSFFLCQYLVSFFLFEFLYPFEKYHLFIYFGLKGSHPKFKVFIFSFWIIMILCLSIFVLSYFLGFYFILTPDYYFYFFLIKNFF